MVPSIAAEKFVGALARQKYFDSVGATSLCKRKKRYPAAMPAIAFEMPHHPRPEFEELVPVERHTAQVHSDMASGPFSAFSFAVSHLRINDIAVDLGPEPFGQSRD